MHPSLFGRIAAFIRRDILIETSYKLSLALNMTAVFSSLLVYFFIDRLFGGAVTPHLTEFGIPYFSYVLVGMAFFSFAGAGLGSLPERLRQEQVQGTLESLLVTPCPLIVLILCFGASSLLFAAIDFIIYALMGIFIFHVDFSGINLISAGTVFLLTIVCFSSVGIVSASFIMRFKRGNVTGWLMNNVQALFGGVYFPVTVLPEWMQEIGRFIPLTHAVRAFERAVYAGATLRELQPEITALTVFTVVLVPVSLLCLSSSLNAARRDGSLSQY